MSKTSLTQNQLQPIARFFVSNATTFDYLYSLDTDCHPINSTRLVLSPYSLETDLPLPYALDTDRHFARLISVTLLGCYCCHLTQPILLSPCSRPRVAGLVIYRFSNQAMAFLRGSMNKVLPGEEDEVQASTKVNVQLYYHGFLFMF